MFTAMFVNQTVLTTTLIKIANLQKQYQVVEDVAYDIDTSDVSISQHDLVQNIVNISQATLEDSEVNLLRSLI
jgi:hypothetical protein